MKKIMAVVMTCVLVIASIPCVAFAENIDSDGAFGVITNVNGEIVEVIPMPRTNYLDKVFTLDPGDTLTTYQYEPSNYFCAGFVFGEGTTRDRVVRIDVYGSKKIGGDNRTSLVSQTFSTNVESNLNNKYYSEYLNSICVEVRPDNSLTYYNGAYTNVSSSTMRIRITVDVG